MLINLQGCKRHVWHIIFTENLIVFTVIAALKLAAHKKIIRFFFLPYSVAEIVASSHCLQS